jgi:DNA-binding beta-propeller fold protein YncE
MRTITSLLLTALAATALLAADSDGYRLLKTIAVPGDGGWDYLVVDEAGRRVYVSHGTQVDVLDADSGAVKGKIADTKGVHGIAIAADQGRGFTSNGKADSVTIFDLKNLKTLGEVKTGKNQDCIIYDPDTRRVFAFNGGGASATVIDAAKGEVVGTIDLGGRPARKSPQLPAGNAPGYGNVCHAGRDSSPGLTLPANGAWQGDPSKHSVC